MNGKVATAQIDIDASTTDVWTALTDPKLIKEYMFGSDVDTSWEPGSPITWSGEYEGKKYQDKGEVLEVVPQQRLRLTHFSAMSGQPDKPENYHQLQYELADHDGATTVTLTQDGNKDKAEADRAAQNWSAMLAGMKKVVERTG